MKKLTYNNLIKLTKRIARNKHYNFQEALILARQCFDNCEVNKERTAEWFAERLLSKEEYEEEYAL